MAAVSTNNMHDGLRFQPPPNVQDDIDALKIFNWEDTVRPKRLRVDILMAYNCHSTPKLPFLYFCFSQPSFSFHNITSTLNQFTIKHSSIYTLHALTT